MLLVCLSMSAISMLKSPHNVCTWFGCVVIWLVISVLRCGIRHVFVKCVDIYMCIINHSSEGWLLILIICKYGEIFAGVGNLVIFSRNAYLLWISVSRPPLMSPK